jgi:hypothetical protein
MIFRQPALEDGKFVSPKHQPPLPLRRYSWYLFLLEADSTPKNIVRPAGLNQRNISKTPSGIEPAKLPACSAVPQPTALGEF